MGRGSAIAALLAATVLAGCETTDTTAPGAAPTVTTNAASAGTSGLPDRTYGNAERVRGVRHVALDQRLTDLTHGVVTSLLKIPGTARFDANLVAAEAGHMVLVCGTLTASDGNRTYTGVPYAAFIDFDMIRAGDFLGSASVYGLFSTVARADAALVQTTPRLIQAYCRQMNGAVLPDFAPVDPAPPAGTTATAPLTPRPR